jgi:phenylacetate-coenzyme A ligase PaaK-like adenylate-forming protein
MDVTKRNSMHFDFSKLRLKNRAFSEKPMTFIDEAPRNVLAAVTDIVAIETGNRTARDHWQFKQLQNLLQHAAQHSAFWRERIGRKNIKNTTLAELPILTRGDVVRQVETEGNLLKGPIATSKHATSGSSGTPVRFFISEMNAQYNFARTAAQYLMEGRDLTLNRTRFISAPNRNEAGFSVEKTATWLDPLSALFKVGNNKEISHLRPNRDLLFKELAKDPIGYFIAQPRLVEALFYDCDVSFLSEHGTKMFIPISEEAEKDLRDKFAAAGIPVRATYSSEEVGCIAVECVDFPGTYHVAQSNVIVETDGSNGVIVGASRLGKVLVTHLHSYATPFVRYDIGDVATLSQVCRCGHDGPVLSNIYGRKKRLLKHADGSVAPFLIKSENMLKIVKCDEFRIRQTTLDTIEVQIGGIDRLSDDQITSLKTLFREHAGEFQLRISATKTIDWGNDIKRLGFQSEVL